MRNFTLCLLCAYSYALSVAPFSVVSSKNGRRATRSDISMKVIESESRFLFTTCQAGSERALKDEFKKYYPELLFAFSRPGLVTWKSPYNLSPDVEIKSTFTRCYGVSLGQANNTDVLYEIAASIAGEDKKLCLHVYGRDEGTARSEHPIAIKDKLMRIEMLKNDILSLDSLSTYSIFSDESNHVLDVIIGEEFDKWLIGHHIFKPFYTCMPSNDLSKIDNINRYKWRNHSPHVGGIPNTFLPEAAPSRAYLKIEDIIEWAELDLQAEQTVLEIGSAPGGVCFALLQRGLKVTGVDPSPPDRMHAPVIARNPNFNSIKSTLENLDHSKLPTVIDWLLCDANISPEIAFPYLVSLLKRYDNSLKGFIYTIKLGDDLWGKSIKEPLVDYIGRIERALYGRTSIRKICTTQLTSNRQEVTLVGLSSCGLKYCRFPLGNY